MVEGEVAADIADAEAAIARLNVEARSLVDTESLARILLRAESVASSRIRTRPEERTGQRTGATGR